MKHCAVAGSASRTARDWPSAGEKPAILHEDPPQAARWMIMHSMPRTTTSCHAAVGVNTSRGRFQLGGSPTPPFPATSVHASLKVADLAFVNGLRSVARLLDRSQSRCSPSTPGGARTCGGSPSATSGTGRPGPRRGRAAEAGRPRRRRGPLRSDGHADGVAAMDFHGRRRSRADC